MDTESPSTRFLDDAYALLLQGDGYNGMDAVFKGLKSRRVASSPNDWRKFIAYCIFWPNLNSHSDPI